MPNHRGRGRSAKGNRIKTSARSITVHVGLVVDGDGDGDDLFYRHNRVSMATTRPSNPIATR